MAMGDAMARLFGKFASKTPDALEAESAIMRLRNASKVAEAAKVGEEALKAAQLADMAKMKEETIAELLANKELAARRGGRTQSQISNLMAQHLEVEPAIIEKLQAQNLDKRDIATQLNFQKRKKRQSIGQPNPYLQAVPVVAGAGVAAGAMSPTARLMQEP